MGDWVDLRTPRMEESVTTVSEDLNGYYNNGALIYFVKNEPEKLETIDIYDMTGRCLLSEKVTDTQRALKIKLKAGGYVMRVSYADGVFKSYKFHAE